MENGYQKLENGDQEPENGDRKLENGDRKLENGGWEPENGDRKLVSEARRPGREQRSPPVPGGPMGQYIRSGPEGARGVLDVRGLSLCMLLSALSSALSSPNSCGFSSEALCVLLTCMCLWEPGGVRA